MDISDSIRYTNKNSSVLYSPWASDHLNSHWNNWITVSILQYRVTFWTPKIVPRLGKLRKSVGSFCIRCSLGLVLGSQAGTISSWAVPEKTAKKLIRQRQSFWHQNHQLPAWPLQYFLFMADVWDFCDTFLDPKVKALFLFFKSSFVAEIQGSKITPLLHVKSKVPICSPWPLLYFLFMADGWNFCGIFLRL